MSVCPSCGIACQDGSVCCPKCGAGLQQAGMLSAASADLPIAENIAGALAYFMLPAIVLLFLEPYRRNFFARFHSLQCLLTTAAFIAFAIVLSLASVIVHYIPIIGVFLVLVAWPLFGLAGILLWLLVVYKAYLHEIFKLPIVGDLAERLAEVS